MHCRETTAASIRIFPLATKSVKIFIQILVEHLTVC